MSDLNILQRHRDSAHARLKAQATYCIDGETLSLDAIAARLGVSNQQASNCLARARKQPDVVSWALLGRFASTIGSRVPKA